MPMMDTDTVVKTYESVQLNRVLDETLHPGGIELTQRMAEVAGVCPTSHILDVGCGRGTSILFYTKMYGCSGVGMDLSPASLAIALEHSAREGLSERLGFTTAAAGELPYAGAEFDVVFSECSLSLFADKAGAIREMARVVKPGGRIVISDIVLEHTLSDSFKQEIGFVCCFTEALQLGEYEQLFTGAGLDLILAEDHSIELKKTAFRVSAGYGSLDNFWSQFGQGKIPCCGEGSTATDSKNRWRDLFRQGKPGYWLLA